MSSYMSLEHPVPRDHPLARRRDRPAAWPGRRAPRLHDPRIRRGSILVACEVAYGAQLFGCDLYIQVGDLVGMAGFEPTTP